MALPAPAGPCWRSAAHHVANFPARIGVFHGADEVYSVYNHPGWIYAAAPWPAAAPRLLIVAARNNLLGPRMVVFGLPLPSPSVFIGQGPPYTGLGGYDETSRWYLPLPWSANVGMSIEADDGTATIRSREGQSIRIDPALGIPADAPDRGGLSPDEWDRRRGAVLRGLDEAAKLGQQGEPAGGAAKLEAIAQALDGPAELRSVVFYRAALLRMESSRAEGSGALNAALDDCRAALRAEPEPERYGLLEAELLGRLGRQEEARRSLVEWGNRGHAGRYLFEWVLLNWLAGKSLDPGAFLGPARITASPVSSGELAILEALHKGDATRAREILGSQGESLVQYTCGDFHYLKARAFLDLDPPDAEAALAALKQAAEGCVLGTPIPAALARTRARLMRDPAAAVTPDELRAAASDLGQVYSQAYVDVTALFFAQFALRDAEAILKARPGLEPLAAAAASARAEYDRMVHFEPVGGVGRMTRRRAPRWSPPPPG